LQPVPSAPFRAAQEARFERLKHRLLLNRLNELSQGRDNARLRRAANEAAALAWVTPYPLLVYPVLFEEKARSAIAYGRRQEHIREQTSHFLAA
jgi:hypothetical protein